MQSYKLHILGVSECRWTGFGQLTMGTGETILYSGRDDDQHMAGVNNIFKRKRWRWIGHTLRMEPSAHVIKALTWTPEGRKKRGRPRCTWRRTMLGERKEAGMVWSGSSENSPGQR